MVESFPFLSLVPEIRNMVYSALLEFDRPIHIVDLDEYGLYLHHENIAIDPNIPYDKSVVAYQKVHERAGLSGLGLFLVNRQVHREASSTFYGNNVLKLCSKCYLLERPDINARYISQQLIPWLVTLGHHSTLLRRFEIDVTHLTPTDWNDKRDLWRAFRDDEPLSGKGLLEFGPLLCHIWHFDLTQLKVVLVHEQPITDLDSGALQPDCNAAGVNQILTSLIQDKLGIKKYWHAIGNVSIKRDGSGGIIVFRSKPHLDMAHWSSSGLDQFFLPGSDGRLKEYNSTSTTRFHVQGGDNLRFVIREPPTLMSLPKSVRTRILDLIFGECQNINLDTATDIMSLYGAFHIARLVGYPNYSCLSRHFLSLEMTFKFEDGANETALARLQRLLQLRMYRSPWQMADDAPLFARSAQSTIQIVIDGNEQAAPRDFRYDVVKLIEATLSLDGGRLIHFRMKNAPDLEFGGNWWSIRISKLRNNTFISWPKTTRPFEQELPEIEMNGLGEVTAIRTGQGSVPARNKNLRTKWSSYWLSRKWERKWELANQARTTDFSIENTLPEGRSSYEMREWLKKESKLGKWASLKLLVDVGQRKCSVYWWSMRIRTELWFWRHGLFWRYSEDDAIQSLE